MDTDAFKDHDIKTPAFTLKGIRTYARLVSIYDGDTITCVIPVFQRHFKFNVRLNGIDTCEMRSDNPLLKSKALEARQYLANRLCATTFDLDVKRMEIERHLQENVVLCWIVCHGEDKYGRILSDIYLSHDDPVSLSQQLIDARLAYAYAGDTKLTTEQILGLLK
jgi:endonuclease YncB( thermonuclease family)